MVLCQEKVQVKSEAEGRAVDVIEVITNTGLKYEESEVNIDMWQAIQEMKKEVEMKKAQEDAKRFYELGGDIEKVAQGVGYAIDIVKGWVGLSPDA